MSTPYTEIKLPEQTIVNGEVFPLCISFESAKGLNEWLKNNPDDLDALLRKHYAIIFRDCGLSTVQDFHDAIEASGLKGGDYVGGAALRTQLTSRVFTANDSPAHETIPFHHEMAYAPAPPTHLFFFCEKQPETQGETRLSVSHLVINKLKERNPQFLADLEIHGIKYVRIMPEHNDETAVIGRGWRQTFSTETREGAEAALTKLGSTWEWLPNGDLKTITAPFIAIREEGGQKVFFNSIVVFNGLNDTRNIGAQSVILNDGKDTVCDPQGIQDVLSIIKEIEVAVPWKTGDIMLVDNRTAMHARRPFTGPRRVLASLVRDHDRK